MGKGYAREYPCIRVRTSHLIWGTLAPAPTCARAGGREGDQSSRGRTCSASPKPPPGAGLLAGHGRAARDQSPTHPPSPTAPRPPPPGAGPAHWSQPRCVLRRAGGATRPQYSCPAARWRGQTGRRPAGAARASAPRPPEEGWRVQRSGGRGVVPVKRSGTTRAWGREAAACASSATRGVLEALKEWFWVR